MYMLCMSSTILSQLNSTQLNSTQLNSTTLNYYLFCCLGQGCLVNIAAQCEGGGGAVAVGGASAVSSHERRGE